VSPILVRPVREQLEHDRLIRFLLPRYKRKFEVAANVGEEKTNPVKLGASVFFPDLILTEGRKLAGLVEVETGESVNNLEAMSQWVPFGRARAPFLLYVPVLALDAARRLCESHQVTVAELWTYRGTLDGFDLVRVMHNPSASTLSAPAPAAEKGPKKPKPERPVKVDRPAVKAPERPAKVAERPAKAPERPAKPERVSRPVKAPVRRPTRPAKAAKKPVRKAAGKR
jgi:hypothetical protein